MSRFLTILEVSQKQAYIFSSNELSACVERSDQIAAITSAQYLEGIAGSLFSADENLVYAGGGHTILQFPEKEKAESFCRKVTTHVHEVLPDIELFTTTIKYDDGLSHSDNQKALIRKLEKKKALRKASFHQGTFGVEKLDVNTKKPVAKDASPTEHYVDETLDERLMPQGFRLVKEFGKLGGSKDESNYIAIIHIDGNGMGSRVSEYYAGINDRSWEEFREKEKGFSEAIDEDYKKAYAQMKPDAEKVMGVIEEYGGVLPFTDKASPEVIEREMQMSKAAFKRAVGHLLKEKKIEITATAIRKL